jgi:hypothetical protein
VLPICLRSLGLLRYFSQVFFLICFILPEMLAQYPVYLSNHLLLTEFYCKVSVLPDNVSVDKNSIVGPSFLKTVLSFLSSFFLINFSRHSCAGRKNDKLFSSSESGGSSINSGLSLPRLDLDQVGYLPPVVGSSHDRNVIIGS